MGTDANWLLKWLGKEDSSAYGECECAELDRLFADGLVYFTSARTGERLNKPLDGYTRVHLTDKGQDLLTTINASEYEAKAHREMSESVGSDDEDVDAFNNPYSD